MTRGLVRLVGALLLLGLSACGGGCAGRRSTDGGAAPGTATEAAPAAEVPEPPPVPVVPQDLRCTLDVDCTSSAFPRAVTASADCYCPTCPGPLAVDAASAHETAWQRLCGAAWEGGARCEAPMCRRPPPVVCRDGACVAASAP